MNLQYVFLLFICFLFFSCNAQNSTDSKSEKAFVEYDSSYFHKYPHNIKTYDASMLTVFKTRDSLSQLYKRSSSEAIKNQILEKSGVILQSLIVQKIIPYWYGTEWKFDGYTAIPQTGSIACGYFVSTTLLHSGLTVNRYKLAQQSPKNEAKSLACGNPFLTFTNSNRTEVIDYFNKNMAEGLYFVGLEFHVGYLLFYNKQLYFIHSNYIFNEGVTVERVENSFAFRSSEYYIVPISENKKLVQKWLLKDNVAVILK